MELTKISSNNKLIIGNKTATAIFDGSTSLVKNPTLDKFINTTQGFRSQSNKKDDFFTFNKNVKETYGNSNELYQETIINLKKEVNIKSKELNSLKVQLNLLSIEDKKKMKVIESILNSSNKSSEDIDNLIENLQTDKFDLSTNSIIKLREIYIINFLKNQVSQLKFIIKEREDEIKILKENSKVTKIIQLDNQISSLQNENKFLKENIERLMVQHERLKEKYLNNKSEFEALYKNFTKNEREIERLAAHNSKAEEDYKNLLQQKKKSEEESNKYKVSMINIKQDLKYKTEYLNFTKNTEEKVVKLEKERESLFKKIDALSKEKVKLNNQNRYFFILENLHLTLKK